jgi:1-pyrroline-5-carboxylate dehydrogenase
LGKNWNEHSPLQNIPKNCRETGGKDFIIAHSSANPKQVATELCVVLEFQGQKCSAASRYVPQKFMASD